MLNYKLLNNLGEIELKIVLVLDNNGDSLKTTLPHLAKAINSSPEHVMKILKQLVLKNVISKSSSKGRNGFTKLTLLTSLF